MNNKQLTQPNDEGCSEEMSNSNGGLEMQHISSFSFFPPFIYSINNLSTYRQAICTPTLTPTPMPIDTNGKEGPKLQNCHLGPRFFFFFLVLLTTFYQCLQVQLHGPEKDHNQTEPQLNATGLLVAVACFSKWKTAKDWPQSVAISFRYSLKIHTFWAYFEEKQPRNAWHMAKMTLWQNMTLCD